MNERLTELWVMITDDKRKAGVLGALMVVMFLMGIRTFVSGGPDQATAEVRSTSGVDEALRASSLDGGSVLLSEISGGEIVAVPAQEPVSRDLFAIEEAYFPQTAQSDQSDGSGDKSGSGSADSKDEGSREEADTAAVRIADEASVFVLRSTLVGGNPVAILETGSGEHVVSEGDTLDGFVIRTIGSHEVRLEKEGVTVAVRRR